MRISTRFQTIGALLLVAFSVSAVAKGPPGFTELVDEVAPAVVNVRAIHTMGEDANRSRRTLRGMPPAMQQFFKRYFDGPSQPRMPRSTTASGSGFIISPDGNILTNYHVIRNATKIIVQLSDGREMQAEVIGVDEPTDIALLDIDAENLPTVEIGNSRDLEVGQWVIAIGAPFGFDHTVTAGIISAVGRPLPNQSYVPFIQTDVAINQGNSGGPLINMQGEVIGINSQIFTSTGAYMGVSFAIPIHVAMDVVEQLREDGDVDRGWLGVQIQRVTPGMAEVLGLSGIHGALVADILPDSPAAESELQVRDVIVKFNGQFVESHAKLPPMVGLVDPGTTVTMTVVRDGERIQLDVTLGELEEDAGKPVGGDSGDAQTSPLGLAVEDAPEEMLEEMGLDGGVIVRRVLTIEARRAGIRPGDIIVSVDNERISDEDEFESVVESLEPGRPVALLVRRGDASLFIALTPSGGEETGD